MTAPTRPPVSAETFAETRPPNRRVGARIDEWIASQPIWVLLIQVFIGLGWQRAAAEKLLSGPWWSGDVIRTFLIENQDATLDWYQPFLDLVVRPFSPLVAVVVLAVQIVAGASLLRGRFVGFALAAGVVLNLNFIAAGAVNPSAFYLVLQGAIALWLAEQTRAVRRTGRALIGVSVLGGGLAALSLPFMSSLDPHGVIDDPAAMLVTGGVLAVLSSALVYDRIASPDAARKLADGE